MYNVSVRGANGQDGQDGAGLQILGNYNSMAELIAAHPTGSAGDAYMVGTDLVVWNTQTSSWQNVGRIQGPSGSDGLWLAIDNDDDGTNANVTYTAHLMKGLSTDATSLYSAVFVWQLVNENGVTELATSTPTITVARDSAQYGSTIRCICVAVVDEDNLQDYSYATIQDYQGNDITIIGANSVKLIGESELYKPYAISAQFQVLSDEISSKVSQTDFNSLSGTVTQQGTAIQQNASAISLKADQSTVNTLSGTVSQQGTAIEQNAQAITLKADTSTVNSQMSGKMATDMSNRSSSITINSGEIKFESNSVSISATNLTVTKTGQVTSVDFQAKNSLRLLDSNNVLRGQLTYNSVGGTTFIEKNQSGNTVAVISGADSDGGQLRLYNSSGTQTANIDGQNGNITVNGKITGGSFGAISAQGNISSTGMGTFTSGIICGGLTAKTQIVAANNSGTAKVFFAATDTYGYGAFRNANGDNNIYLRGNTGNAEFSGTITCYDLVKTSSRKVKKNIKPIEDSEKILLLNAVSFDYKDKEKGTDKRGFIAEDVKEVLPNLVREETEEIPMGIDYVSMIPYLQDIIKKQHKQIDYLMAEVEKLKGEK